MYRNTTKTQIFGHGQVSFDSEGNKSIEVSSGNSVEIGHIAEKQLVKWIEELHSQGWPPEWWDVHAAAISIARAQGCCPYYDDDEYYYDYY